MKEKEKFEFTLVAIFAAYVVFVPGISIIPSLGPYNEKRILQIGVLLVVGSLLLVSSASRKWVLIVFSEIPSLACWGFGMVLSLGVFSAALAPEPAYAFLELSHFVLLFVGAGVVASAVRETPQQTERVLLDAVVVSALLYAVYFAVRYATSFFFQGVGVGQEIITRFVNPRFFNQYQTWTLPLLGGAVLALPKTWPAVRGGVFGLVAIWWTLVFASNVTGTILAMAVATVGVGLIFQKQARHWIGVQGAAVLIGGVLYFALFYLAGSGAPQFGERLSHASTESWRVVRWKTCLSMVMTHPFLGAGPMHFAWPPFHFMTGAHPHNAFFQWLAEWGIPSTGIMSGLTIWGGWRWIEQEMEDAESSFRSNELGVALTAAVLAGTAHAMVSGIIVMPVSQVLLVLVGGWAWGRYRPQHQSSDSEIPIRSHALLCVLLIAAMGMVGSSLKDLLTVEERRDALIEAADRNQLSPRYWGQGFLHVRDSEVIERARRNR
jgi:O-antigen ligase